MTAFKLYHNGTCLSIPFSKKFAGTFPAVPAFSAQGRIYINIYRPPPLTTVRCAHRALIHIRFTFIVFRYKSYLCCEKLSITQPFSYIIILTHTDYSTTELLQMVTIRLLKNPFEKLSNGSIYSMVRPTGFEPTAFRVGV